MKRCLVLAILMAVHAVAADNFWTQLTPEERAAAGVADLTPAQREALDRLAGRFAKEGARQAVEVVKAEAKQRKVANAGLVQGEKEEVIRTRIAGEFRGWDGRTTFRFESGQVWQQVDSSERFSTTPQANPEVELHSSRIGGWKLFVASVDRWVRVKRVR